MRLDRALVERGLVTSRTRAAAAIAAGRVRLDGVVVTKAATPVADEARVTITGEDQYVSRAAHKLLGAFQAFGIDRLDGRTAIDAGSSTGGFTQVLLERGVSHVTGFDVGHDQLDVSLRNDPRVSQHDGVNLRDVPNAEPVDLIVADLSFISLTYVLPTLAALAKPDADIMVLVKPQFEVGRADLGAGGLVTDPRLHAKAIWQVIDAAAAAGLHVADVAASPLPGSSGNREFFVRLGRPSTMGWAQSHVAAKVDKLVTGRPDLEDP